MDRMLIRKDAGIGWLIFNNPERRNAVSLDMMEAIPSLMAELAEDPEIRVIVLTGAGDKAFISGADISEFDKNRSSAEAQEHYAAAGDRARLAIDGCDRPTVAAINGYCFGGGVALAMVCDLRLASETARFSIPAARLGLAYGVESLDRLVGLVGPAVAREMMYTASRYDADDALRIGLVNRVFPAASFRSEVEAYAGTISNNAPLTIRAAKLTIAELMKDETQRDMAAVSEAIARCFDSQDYREGRTAFMEKRKPVFRGR